MNVFLPTNDLSHADRCESHLATSQSAAQRLLDTASTGSYLVLAILQTAAIAWVAVYTLR